MDTSVVAGIVGGLGAAIGAIVVQRWRAGVHDRIFKAGGPKPPERCSTGRSRPSRRSRS